MMERAVLPIWSKRPKDPMFKAIVLLTLKRSREAREKQKAPTARARETEL